VLIVSKFHDYYDTALGLGVDKSLVYRRVNEPGSYLSDAPRWQYDLKEETHRVGFSPSDVVKIESWVVPLIFCGKFYRRAIALVHYQNPNRYLGAAGRLTDCYTGASRKEVLARVREQHRLNEKTEEKPKYRRWRSADDRVTFKEFAETRDWTEDHIREGCPVFLIRQLTRDEHLELFNKKFINAEVLYRIEKNPCLKELGFYQVKDPYEAYQELAMFLGGVMGTDARPMVQLSDQEVHQKHGFDKWSFRKMPEPTK
jgi:hypothetical protein